MSQKKKPGCFGKMIRFICLFLIFAAIFGAANNSDKDTPKPTDQQATEFKPETTAAPTDAPTSKPAFDPEAAKTVLDAMLSESYSYHSISGDETGFVITVSAEGLGQALYLTKQSQNADLLKTWEATKQTFVYLYGNVQDFLKTSGMEKPILMMNVVNDQNYDDIVLSVYENVVIYDAITQK